MVLKTPRKMYMFSRVHWLAPCLVVLSLVEGSTLRVGLWFKKRPENVYVFVGTLVGPVFSRFKFSSGFNLASGLMVLKTPRTNVYVFVGALVGPVFSRFAFS